MFRQAICDLISRIYPPQVSCQRVTCGSFLLRHSASVSVEARVFLQDVVRYPCEAGYTVTGLVSEVTFLRHVAWAAATWHGWCCELRAGLLRHHFCHGRTSCHLFQRSSVYSVCRRHVPRHSTDGTNKEANPYSISCKASGMLSGIDGRCMAVLCPVPSVPHTSSRRGTTVGEQLRSLPRVERVSNPRFMRHGRLFHFHDAAPGDQSCEGSAGVLVG